MLKTANVTHLSIMLQKLWQKRQSEKLPHMNISFQGMVCICFVADLQTGLNHSHPTKSFWSSAGRVKYSPTLAFTSFLT